MIAAAANQSELSRARLAQTLTIGWMAIELLVALAAGIAARSVALTAFGVDSGIEIFTAAVVLRRLRQRSASEERGELTAGERTAAKLVGYGLYGLIGYIAISSAAAFAFQLRPEASPVGIGLGLVSIVVMAVLWRWRLRLADVLGSPALRGDAACSVVCLYMSAAMLGGLLLNSAFGFWWADPLAGIALIWWIRSEANEALEASRPR